MNTIGLAVGPGQDADLHRQFVGHRRPQRVVPPQGPLRLVPWEADESGDDRVDRVQSQAHAGDHAEVSATAAQRPVQSPASRRSSTIVVVPSWSTDLEPRDVVECESGDAVERSVSTAERQPDDPDAAIGSRSQAPGRTARSRRRHRLRSIRLRRTPSATRRRRRLAASVTGRSPTRRRSARGRPNRGRRPRTATGDSDVGARSEPPHCTSLRDVGRPRLPQAIVSPRRSRAVSRPSNSEDPGR